MKPKCLDNSRLAVIVSKFQRLEGTGVGRTIGK